ncbi:hypothetical protein DFH08DRAFT_1004631 [Mycena albidolilacea]|uniref:Uncharacterized protein n=1 Tax=Mycena albidolilacea TaxID=1033008 RepID=A0AAD7AS37_9AGAR|nr:hypothetical protein DFH08DRAFT_1004631 [Mycena albidolilacea]
MASSLSLFLARSWQATAWAALLLVVALLAQPASSFRHAASENAVQSSGLKHSITPFYSFCIKHATLGDLDELE